MVFVKAFDPDRSAPETSLWFLFKDQRVAVLQQEETVRIPLRSDLDRWHATPAVGQYFGMLDDRPCFTGAIQDEARLPRGLALRNIRSLFPLIDGQLMMVLGLAGQLTFWERSHRFCGSCGHPTRDKQDERAKLCPECGLVNYPRVSPAVIVAVLKDDRILLARSPRFRGSFYSVLAGFVEPGETLEECVKREVYEEVGITVKNISYFGSQPWPFPDSEMIGFTAEYESGEIRPDETEIADAGWYSVDNLPEIPPRISIARALIDWFLEQHRLGPTDSGGTI